MKTPIKTPSEISRRRPKPSIESPKPSLTNQSWWLLPSLLSFAALALAYLPAIRAPFVFDDLGLPFSRIGLAENPLDWIGIIRPTLMLSYAANYVTAGPNPFWFHFTNLLVHFASGIFVLLISLRLLQASATRPDWVRWLAGLAALIFLFHPLQTESVAYVAGRSESLSGMFTLAALAAFLHWQEAGIPWTGAVSVLALFGLALTSKEQAAVLPLVLLLTDYYFNPGFSSQGIRKNWRIYALLFFGALAGGVLILKVLASAGTAGFNIKDFTWYQYFFTQFRAWWVYVRLFVFPVGQSVDYVFPISRSVLDRGAIFGLAGMVATIVLAVWYRRKFPLASYGVLFFLILLAPTSSFVPIADALAERRMYLPSLGLIFVVLEVVRRLKSLRTAIAVLGIASVMFAAATWNRSHVWASSLALWQNTASSVPGNSRAHYMLGLEFYKTGLCQQAASEYARATQLNPTSTPTYAISWAFALDCLKQPREGIRILNMIPQGQRDAQEFSLLGKFYAETEQADEAFAAFLRAEQLDPSFANNFAYRGSLYWALGNNADAQGDFQRALALDPQNPIARAGISRLPASMQK